MSLLDDAMETCVYINKTKEADGYGGFKVHYTLGAEFSAAIVYNSSLEARVAEKQGVTGLYTITTKKATNLEYHDLFRRESDGKIFRVTSDGDDNLTPASAALNMRQSTAEEFVLGVAIDG